MFFLYLVKVDVLTRLGFLHTGCYSRFSFVISLPYDSILCRVFLHLDIVEIHLSCLECAYVREGAPG